MKYNLDKVTFALGIFLTVNQVWLKYFLIEYLYSKDGKSSTTLAAVAFQDHLVRSLNLGLGAPVRIGPRQVGLGPAAKAKQKQKKEIKSQTDTGLRRQRPKGIWSFNLKTVIKKCKDRPVQSLVLADKVECLTIDSGGPSLNPGFLSSHYIYYTCIQINIQLFFFF